jgi:hypothetical protein
MNLNPYGYERDDATVRCSCKCHGTVVLGTFDELKAFLNCPPRFDSSLAWAESCSNCEQSHWLAATVHDEIEHLGSSGDENLAVYLINHPRNK